jgi:hypothetical protein
MPVEIDKPAITDDQANEALGQIMAEATGTAPPAAEEAAPEQSTTATAPVETGAVTATEGDAVEVTTEAPADDLESLMRRNEELQAEQKAANERFDAQLEAIRQRNAANEGILADRYRRKATVADRALKTLRATRTEDGVSEQDVDRVIREMEGTMHPDSTSYATPEASPMANEDQALVLNSFLNEQRMTAEQADEFGKWIRSDATTVMSPTEQAVANESLGGFLRLAHVRWQEAVHEKEKEATRNDAVGAVRSVQRTQREAARAASAPASAPQKQLEAPAATVDLSKLKDEDIATLLRQSVEQHK